MHKNIMVYFLSTCVRKHVEQLEAARNKVIHKRFKKNFQSL